MLEELDLILGKGSVDKMRRKWLEIVPVLLALGNESKNKNIKAILKTYSDKDDFLESFSTAFLSFFQRSKLIIFAQILIDYLIPRWSLRRSSRYYSALLRTQKEEFSISPKFF